MTDTELRERLGAAVDEIDAPADLLHRARAGGSRRLRRRRFLSLSVAAVSLVTIGGVAVVAPGVIDGIHGAQPAGSISSDPYGFLLKGSTRGDLAKDTAYQNEAIKVWNSSHEKSLNASRGIFDDLRGPAKVAWAGTTSGGKAAIIVQQAYLHRHEDIQLDGEGIQTLVGFIAEGADGKQSLIADGYPAPGVGLAAGFVTGGPSKALVVMNLGGGKMGFSKERNYTGEGSARTYTPLTFDESVSILSLPAGTNLDGLQISILPAKTDGTSESYILDNRPPPTETPDGRLWNAADNNGIGLWPMTDGAEAIRKTAEDDFGKGVDSVSDPSANSVAMTMWCGYGVTPNGTRVLIGEQQLDYDPTHLFAVLLSPSGIQTVVQGGVPDAKAALPVAIKLPAGQGWAVAQYKADLSFRSGKGEWSTPRKNAALVPAGNDVEVKVDLGGGQVTIVPLR